MILVNPAFFTLYFWNLKAKVYYAEQKEKQKLMYQKFKAEVDQHMQEFRSIVEGLEAQEIEFRGLMKKQSMATSSPF